MKKTVFENIGETLFSDCLENGLSIQVVPRPGFVKSFALFATHYGGADRRFQLEGRRLDTPAGVAHFLEHKMFDTPDGGNALSVLSSNGASPNAFTGQGMTAYHFESTTGFHENLKTLLNFVSVPYFTEESVQKEQGIIGQEIRMIEDSPDHAVYYNLMRCLYASNPVRDSIAGTVESIAEISAETLYDCHRAFYRPSNMALCVVGDVDPEEVRALACEILPHERGEVPAPDYGPAETMLPACLRSDAVMAVSAPQFLLGAKVSPAPAGAERLRQIVTAELALRCLMGRASPFYSELYARGLLSHDFGFEFDLCAGTATVLAGGESRDPEAILTALSESVERVSKRGLDPALFERTRRACFGARLRALGSFSGLAVSLAEGHFDAWRPFDAFRMLEELHPDDCVRFLTETLTPERLALSVVRPGAAREQGS